MKRTIRPLALILALLCIFSFTGCLKYTSNILEVMPNTQYSGMPQTEYHSYYTPTSTQPYATEPISTYYPESTSGFEVPTSNIEVPSSVPYVTNPSIDVPTTNIPVSEVPTTQAAAKDPSKWTKAETLKYLSESINKTRAITTPVSVHHSEAFSFTVSDMAKVVADVVNKIIASVADPNEEDLNFNGGVAVNSEGETVPLLLPKKGNFYLDDAGCKSASASKSGANTIVKISLIQETVDMNTAPKYNSSACGYLDTSTLDIPSIIKISNFNIDYQGTDVTYTINPDGYVISAAYHVPLALDISGKAVGISANIKISGYEDEVWTVNL